MAASTKMTMSSSSSPIVLQPTLTATATQVMEDDQESDLAPWTTPLDIVIEAYAISVIRNAGWLIRVVLS